MGKEENNKSSEVEALQKQVADLEKLANYYMQKATQLENQMVLAQQDK